MGIGVSLILIAVGAILTWAVKTEPEGLDINVVGVILMIVGLAGLVLSFVFWESWFGRGAFRRTTYVEGGAAPPGYAGWGRRRRTYVEEDAPPPPPGPPPGPPL